MKSTLKRVWPDRVGAERAELRTIWKGELSGCTMRGNASAALVSRFLMDTARCHHRFDLGAGLERPGACAELSVG
jgi:hypothetical protein